MILRISQVRACIRLGKYTILSYPATLKRLDALLNAEVSLTLGWSGCFMFHISFILYLRLSSLFFNVLLGRTSMILVGRIISDEHMDLCVTSPLLHLQITVEDGPHCIQSLRSIHTLSSRRSQLSSVIYSRGPPKLVTGALLWPARGLTIRLKRRAMF